MLLFFLPLALLAILVTLSLVLGLTVVRAIRTAIVLRRAEFQVTPEVITPGEGMRVWARVMPRGERPVTVRAELLCTMFDHRPRALYGNTHQLTPVFDKPHEFVAFVQMPPYALRSGAIGDELSNLFSEDAHRLLISWSIDFEVCPVDDPDAVLARVSIPIEVPEGRALRADRTYMDQLIVDTCAAMSSHLVFNWLVQVAAADGMLDTRERALLHEVLRSSFTITDPEVADARIAVEMLRDLQIDPVILRKHVAPESLLSLYRLLYAMAWRDGQLDGREHAFLVAALEKLGLAADVVNTVEREVMHGMAQRAIG